MLLTTETADPNVACPAYATLELSDTCGVLMSICILIPMKGNRAENG